MILRCLAGLYQDRAAQTRCEECPVAYSSPGNLPGQVSCQPCDAGVPFRCVRELFLTTSSDPLLGKFKNVNGSGACLPCGLGQYSLSGRSFCSPCLLGSFASEKRDTCLQPEPGYYSDNTSARAQQPCPKGRYTPVFGLTTCTLCPLSKYSASEHASSCADCGGSAIAPREGSTGK